MAHPPISHDITKVTEAELRDDLATFLNCVAFAEDELSLLNPDSSRTTARNSVSIAE